MVVTKNKKGFSVRLTVYPHPIEVMQEKLKAEYSKNPKLWNKIGLAVAPLLASPTLALAQTTTSAEKIATLQSGFHQIYDLLSRLADPFFVGFFIYGFILYSIDSKGKGLTVLKQGAFAFLGITLLPDILELLRWIGDQLHVIIQSL